MKAIILNQFGGAENFELSEVPVPDYGDQDLLISVKAISLNPSDILAREGNGIMGRYGVVKPLILGWDISGVVERTGSKVQKFKPGDEVFGMADYPGWGGAYAEYIAAPYDQFAMKPSNVSHEAAAGASMAALASLQGLSCAAKLLAGQKILIHDAAHGVGHYAVQMAKNWGAFVIGASESSNRDFILSLGADQFIDHLDVPFERQVREIDFVFDTVGADLVARSLDVIRWGGTFVTTEIDPRGNVKDTANYRGINGYSGFVRSSGADMDLIAKMLNEGTLISHIARTFSFDEIGDAHREIENGNYQGKVLMGV